MKIEGFGNNDGVVEFIQDYIIDGKGFMNDNNGWGIKLDDFYNDFINQADDQVKEKWDQTRFHKAFGISVKKRCGIIILISPEQQCLQRDR